MLFDQARHETRLLRFLNKLAQEFGAGGIGLCRTDRLLHRHEIARQDFAARQLLHVGQQLRTERGTRFKLLVDELIERTFR
jgi:hypothetical protein